MLPRTWSIRREHEHTEIAQRYMLLTELEEAVPVGKDREERISMEVVVVPDAVLDVLVLIAVPELRVAVGSAPAPTTPPLLGEPKRSLKTLSPARFLIMRLS